MYTQLVTGDVPGASTYFNPLLNQSIVPCTSGTRPGSPPNGMHIYETDTSLFRKWNGSSWESVAGGRNTAFSPALTSTGTAPTLGTGSVRNGWYCTLPGPSIQFTFFIRFGTSGAAPGTGNYLISLPVTAAVPFGSTNHSAVGSIQLGDVSASTVNPGSCFVDPAAGTNIGLISAAGSVVGAASPWTWANTDYLSGSIIYPI
jgi:hypothetical protein